MSDERVTSSEQDIYELRSLPPNGVQRVVFNKTDFKDLVKVKAWASRPCGVHTPRPERDGESVTLCRRTRQVLREQLEDGGGHRAGALARLELAGGRVWQRVAVMLPSERGHRVASGASESDRLRIGIRSFPF